MNVDTTVPNIPGLVRLTDNSGVLNHVLSYVGGGNEFCLASSSRALLKNVYLATLLDKDGVEAALDIQSWAQGIPRRSPCYFLLSEGLFDYAARSLGLFDNDDDKDEEEEEEEKEEEGNTSHVMKPSLLCPAGLVTYPF